ncbi:O-antigen ligase family protein [Caenispirillum salinarum]|uniref:O-antigen ligase family protein n=1 Tax=Caenispirillum salinarum TaxID=859058 RepID=UPI00384F8DD5
MERVAFRAGLALVVLAPLPLGANRPWAWSLLALALGLLLVAVRPALPRPLWPAAALWVAVLGWVAAQVTGVAPPVRPEVWARAAAALGQGVAAGASLDADAGRAVLLRLMMAAGCFWLFAAWGTSRRRSASALRVIGWAAVAWAVLGLVLLTAGGDRLPFAEKTRHLGAATGPFPNRNTFALWLGMGLCALAAAAVQVEAHRRWTRAAPWAAGAAVVLVALVLTQSRAGTLAAGIGLAVTLALLGRRRWMLLAVPAGVLALAFLTPLETRLAATAEAPLPRLTVWAVTLEGILAAPWRGIGAGAFPDAFAAARPRALLQPWHYAHQAYLELAWELGVPALLALLAAIGWAVAVASRGALRGSTTAAAGAGAAVAAGLHGLADFSPQIPAAALLLAGLLGLGCGRACAAEVRPRRAIAGRCAPAQRPRPTPAPPDPAPSPGRRA